MLIRKATTAFTVVAVVAAISVGGTSARSFTARGDHAQKGFTLKIGMVLPFTGSLSTYGPSLNKAALLGVNLVNAALKKDHVTNIKIQVVGSEDDQTSASAGVEAAKKLVNVDHAQVLIGSMSSGVTIAIAQSVAFPNHVLMITPTSSDPAITTLKGKNGLLWRIYPSDLLEGAALSAAMSKAFGAKALINVGARNDAYGVALAQVFQKNWKAHGGRIGKVVEYDPNSTTFDADAATLASGNPDGWMIVDFLPTFAKMGPALVRTGNWSPAKTFMNEAMSDSAGLNGLGAPVSEGLRGAAGSSPKGPRATAFSALFKKTYATVPFTGFEGTSFDAVVLACLAAIKADSSSPDVLKKQLRPVSGPKGKAYSWQKLPQAINALLAGQTIAYQGAWGEIDWDSHGDPGTAVYVVWQHASGQTTDIQSFTFKGTGKP
jgi:branched-chain amino acid transport system substrate-binding protein